MLGFERETAVRLLRDYAEDHGEARAHGFATGLQLGVLVARRETAERS